MCNFYEKLNVVRLTEQKIYSDTLLIITTKDFQTTPMLSVKPFTVTPYLLPLKNN